MQKNLRMIFIPEDVKTYKELKPFAPHNYIEVTVALFQGNDMYFDWDCRKL